MSTNSIDNKRIAKNTGMLYIRMIITTLVSLYTSRILLQVLGISDYGLFNVVTGMITMFTFMNVGLSGSSQRFFTIALGKNDLVQCEKTFKVLFTLYIIFSVIFFLSLEVIGMYMIENVLNITPDKIEIAKFIFHFSLISLVFDFMRNVLDVAIIAYEHMNFYAYLSIIESILKLLIVLILSYINLYDSLKLYSVLYMCSSIIIFLIYYFYVYYNCPACKFRFSYDKEMYKEIGSFTAWNILGHVSWLLASQGTNIILNVFLGVRINAARGISNQVNGVLSRFASNFQTAASPQIIKSFAAGDNENMFKLTNNVAKYAGFLCLIVGIPLFIDIEYILNLWLIDVPEHTAAFCRTAMLQSYTIALYFSISKVISAIGKIKWLTICMISTQAFMLVVTYILLKMDININIIIYLFLLPSVLIFYFYLFFAHKYIKYPLANYFKEVIFKNILVIIFSSVPTFFVYYNMYPSFIRLILIAVISAISSIFAIYIWGIDKETRSIVLKKVHSKLNKH